MLKSISNRIIFSFIALIIILVSSLLFIINNNIRDFHISLIKRDMTEKLDFILLLMRDNPTLNIHARPKERDAAVAEISKIINLRVTIINFKGTVLADSDYENVRGMDNHLYRLEVQSAFRDGSGTSIRYSNTLKTDMLYYAKRSENMIIRLAKPLIEVDESLSRVGTFILIAGFAAVGFSMFFIVIISRRITRPIRETLVFADDFSNGNYTKRILNYRNDEIGHLQKSLNRLADTVVEKIESLIFEQNKLEITIESIHDGIAVIDKDKKILIANRAFKGLLDINTTVVGKLYFEAIRSRSMNNRIESALIKGESVYFDEELLNKRHCDVFINPIKEQKNLQGILIILHDVTEKKRMEEMKTDLVGNMSHELKTPIAILKGYLETMEQHLGEKEMASELLKKALSNVDRQSSLINDILKLNRLETSNEFPVEIIDIPEIIQTCAEILMPKAQKKNITIHLNFQNSSIKIHGNRLLAEEVFFNLIDNAISYNKEGGTIDIDLKEEGNKINIRISDTGEGIPEEALERIFERFYRVDKSRSRATGGTGLGLSIVKHAVDILNWRINVDSTKEGAAFIIEFLQNI